MEYEFVIKPDGQVVKRPIPVDIPVNLLPEIEKAFQANTHFRINNIMDVGDAFYGGVSVTSSSAQPYSTWWSVRVKTLSINGVFQLQDGILFPTWAKTGTMLPMNWRVPDEIKLVLGVAMEADSDSLFKTTKHYLVAYDSTGRYYQLPTGNLYDHLELCHGQYFGYHNSAVKALLVALEQFRTSPWNSDLVGDFQNINSPLMFRWKPVGSGFEQQPMMLAEGANWTSLCKKVSNELIGSKISPV